MWLLALVACGGGSPLDTGPTPEAPGRCDDVPVLTWENFGQGFLLENCQSCHAENALFRDTSSDPPPAAIHFGDKATALGLADAILSSATGDAPRMPPRGGVSDEDREKLDIWLQCWEGQ